MPLETFALGKSFGQKRALDRVSLRVEDGDCYGLIGHNGAGKTTFLRALLGLLPVEGEIRVDGLDPTEHPRAVRALMGGVIEVPRFYATLDGRTNLRLLARLQGLTRAAASAEAEQLLERMSLSDAAGTPVRTWSQGMCQRLGLAQALLGRPRYLLLDEPTNGLDPQGILDLRQLLRELVAGGHTTVLLSSHQLGEVAGLCNRVAVVHGGRALVEEETAALLEEGGRRYVVRTDDDGRARALFDELGLSHEAPPPSTTDRLGDHDRGERAGTLVSLDGHEPQAVARALFESGLGLESFSPRPWSLEEIYLRHTRAESAAESRASGTNRDTDAATAVRVPAAGVRPAEPPEPRQPAFAVLRHELARWAARPRLFALLATPVLLALVAIWRRLLEQQQDMQAVADASLFSASRVTAFEAFGRGLAAGLPWLALLAVGLASQALAGERSRGTLPQLLMRPLGRGRVLLGKAGASLVVVLGAHALLVAGSFAGAAWLFDFEDLAEVLPNGELFPLLTAAELWPDLVRATWTPLLPLCACVAWGLFVSVFARRGVTALGVALAGLCMFDLARGFARALDHEGWLLTAHLPSPLGDTSFLAYYADVVVGVSNASWKYAGTTLTVPLLWFFVLMTGAIVSFSRRST